MISSHPGWNGIAISGFPDNRSGVIKVLLGRDANIRLDRKVNESNVLEPYSENCDKIRLSF